MSRRISTQSYKLAYLIIITRYAVFYFKQEELLEFTNPRILFRPPRILGIPKSIRFNHISREHSKIRYILCIFRSAATKISYGNEQATFSTLLFVCDKLKKNQLPEKKFTR